MFGYVRINKQELKVKEYYRYRACYCGLCRTLKKRYGLLGEITLSYDMTFLVMLLNSLYEPEEKTVMARCALHPMTRHPETRTVFSEYGADMNLLLSYYKQKDDWQDDRSLEGLAFSQFLKRKIRRIEKAYPSQAASIQRELKNLSALEKENIQDIEKTSRAFGRLLGAVFAVKEDAWRPKLYGLGYDLGVYIYLADAWDDLEKDRAEGAYNPFPSSITKEREADVHRLLMGVMARAAEKLEYLPLERDVEILRNIIYSGVWTRPESGKKKGLRRAEQGSL